MDVVQSPNSEHALQALEHRSYDAVVADIGFQHDAEISFFDKVMNRHPKVSRLALCDPGGTKPVASANSIHQYVERRAPMDEVRLAIERARFMDTWLLNLQFNRIYKLLKKLPSVPAIYFRLVKALQSSQADLETVGTIVSEDAALTAQILKVVNSAYFGLQRTITSTMEAVSYLGIDRTKALSLVTHTFGQFGAIDCEGFSMDRLWQHSVRAGTVAQSLTKEQTRDPRLAEEAFTASVLHDVGKLMVAVNLPAEFKAVMAKAVGRTFHEAEQEVLGVSHAEVGACMMGSWGLPARIVEAIAFHHVPEQYFDKGFNPAVAVHLGNYLEHATSGAAPGSWESKLDAALVSRLELREKMEGWLESARELPVAA
jgi:HD-like signal output (HDOD) protein